MISPKILLYYKGESNELANEFWEEFSNGVSAAAVSPQRYHFEPTQIYRRFNLKRFPYHFLFEEIPDGIRLMVVRHNKQRPSYGLRRN